MTNESLGNHIKTEIIQENSLLWETIKEEVRRVVEQEYQRKMETDNPERREFLKGRDEKIIERERKFTKAFGKALQEAKRKAGGGKIIILSDFDETFGTKEPDTRKPVLRPSAMPLLEHLKETEKNIEFYFFTDRGEEFLFSNLSKKAKKLLKEIDGKNPRRRSYIYSVFDRGQELRDDIEKVYDAIDSLKNSGAVAEENYSQLKDLKDIPDTLVKLAVLNEIVNESPDCTFLVIEDLNYPLLLNNPRIINLTVDSDFVSVGL